MFELLSKLRVLAANPAIPNGLDIAADYLHQIADVLRSLQGVPLMSGDLDACDALAAECEALATAPRAADGVQAVDPATIMLLVQLAKQVLDLIRKRRAA